MKNIHYCLTALLVLLWAYTSLHKLVDMNLFAKQMYAQKFGRETAQLLIYTLPYLELALALLLLFNRTRLYAFWGSTLLMLPFTIYMALVHFGFYARVPCSCGGVIQSMTFQQHFYFNLFFLAISILGMVLQYQLNRKEVLGKQ